jgi:hypothetical protein
VSLARAELYHQAKHLLVELSRSISIFYLGYSDDGGLTILELGRLFGQGKRWRTIGIEKF